MFPSGQLAFLSKGQKPKNLRGGLGQRASTEGQRNFLGVRKRKVDTGRVTVSVRRKGQAMCQNLVPKTSAKFSS